MNGLLRRLARHAVRPTAPTIHARARRFSLPTPERRHVDGADPAAAAAATAQPATRAERASPAPPTPPTAPTAPTAPTTMTRIARDAPPGAAADLSRAEPATARPVSSAHAEVHGTPLMPEPDSDNRAPRAISPTDSSADGGPHTSGDHDDAAAVDQPHSIGAEPQEAPPRRVVSRTAPPSVPDALLPPVATAATSPPSAGLHATAPDRRPAGDPPTDVHVHIGRIEVTAVQDAAAPKPTARHGRPPMSLDDYLARRQQRGS